MEKREISILSTHNTKLLFDGVQQVAVLTRSREIIKTSKCEPDEIVFLITNIPESEASAEDILTLNRGYWSIENKLHYSKDFVFGEDRGTIRKGHGPRIMSALRNFAVSIFNLSGIQNIKRCVDNIKYNAVAFLEHAFFLRT